MAVTTDKAAPYAPASSVMEVITRYRNRGLPSPITAEVLARAGVSQSLIARTLQALQSLDLIDEEGLPTQILEGLRLAPEAEYPQRLEEWLNQAYAEVLIFVDPAKDDETKIRDAFRSYQPVGQQGRMVTLFLGLFSAAGKVPDRPTRPRAATSAKSTRSRVNKGSSGMEMRQTRPSVEPAGLPAPIAGLLSKLPSETSGWTQHRRDMFLATFEAVIDFCYPIVEEDYIQETQVAEDEGPSATE